MAALGPVDPSSFSEPERCVVTKLHVDLEIDFAKHVLVGSVDITLEKKSEDVKTVILDTRDLTISRIVDRATISVLPFTLGEPTGPFGSKLEITLPTSSDKQVTISIEYSTSETSTALQWLRPEQTAGKRQPYLFSQCQAIHARSLVPCQDTPYVKFPYTAKVTAPEEVTVLMSALRKDPVRHPNKRTTTHEFEQKIPIPSYLIAIVAGDIESRDIGPRSKVWSEKELVDMAAYEFAETEQMLQTAEAMLGPYVWGHYDLLVLPPSFPYGGMENPCLTFVTPTLLAKDRSLANVVAHEISHSWTGNLVTNNSCEHFWLNEGHTVFVERKIASRLHGGEQMRHFMASEGWDALQNAVNTLENPLYTKLIPDLKGVDPDDAFSIVPYEKGFALLFYLETLVGGPDVFEKFLKAYIDTFKYKSINSKTWKNFLFLHFSDTETQKVLNDVDWDAWFFGVGMPPVKPDYDTSLRDPCTNMCNMWVEASEADMSQFGKHDLHDFSSIQEREFINLLIQKPPLPVFKLEKMNELYQFGVVINSEIRFRWIRLGIRAQWPKIIPLALAFVSEQGRMKFVRPIYTDLYKWEAARQKAIDNYMEHKDEMHNTTASLVAKDLKLM
ncbi:leukotriene A-4 hydrolase-like [Gigantopelta aegis]|uniref:leukotriene A-4 hydrolase-like n=1 Tax=Gigantopelta aegis TaxID=1735272 RepID=UPI001B88C591|nr:leukotriene A-4 hydrolase-like [Gigantopelta aegis]